MEYLLSDVQQKAVNDTEGAVLVFAGAGSGKTRVLTYRICHLINAKSVSPFNILAITFTNKATNEMKDRLQTVLGSNSVWVSTLHGLCSKILYNFAEKIGYTKEFSIYDEDMSKRIFNKIFKEYNIEDDNVRNKLLSNIQIARLSSNADEYFDMLKNNGINTSLMSKIYREYEDTLLHNNAFDFEDLIIKALKLLNTCAEALEYYQNRFRYIHVDEFQDTNNAQLELIKLLSGKWGNVFCVGDDDQSIYGWRGANYKNILEFNKFYPDCKMYKLLQNYRSTVEILKCANNLIKNNHERADKTLYSELNRGVPVLYSEFSSDILEAESVIKKIIDIKASCAYSNRDIAILFRQNNCMRLFESVLTKANINYIVYGGINFFDRKEIKDIIAYLRLINNPYDIEALERVINFPPRGIGESTLYKVDELSLKYKMLMLDIIKNIDKFDNIPKRAKNSLYSFATLFDTFQVQAKELCLCDLVMSIVNTLSLEAYYAKSEIEEERSRWRSVQDFIFYIQENISKETTLSNFLHDIALSNNADTLVSDDVTLSTIHAAKGLEFKAVFVVACEEGIIPSYKSIKEENGIEEERRVMYVAVTRARERLYISSVRGIRRKYGIPEVTRPSRFVYECQNAPYKQDSITVDDIPDTKDKALAPLVLDVGKAVIHKVFGSGSVVNLTSSNDKNFVVVAFRTVGVKKFFVCDELSALMRVV